MTEKITLLDRAKADLQNVRLILSHDSSDELFLDIAAYHIQQGVEKLVKFSLSANGVRPKPTHDILVLIEQLEMAGVEVLPWLRENADTLNAYATKTRYGSNIVAVKTKITQLLGLAEEFMISLQPAQIEDDSVKPCCLVEEPS